jgi:hypothetical protein
MTYTGRNMSYLKIIYGYNYYVYIQECNRIKILLCRYETSLPLKNQAAV